MSQSEFDAVVVGAGPNGLSAAITLQRSGLSVLLIEGADTVGGGMRTAELTLPGFRHDVCSAVHPMAAASPFFKSLPLERFGLHFIQPPTPAAHPLDHGEAATLERSLDLTADLLGKDAGVYRALFAPLLEMWPGILPDLLGPLGIPKHPIDLARFGLLALTSAKHIAGRFQGEHARGLFAGMAAHSFLTMSSPTSAAIGLVLSLVGHAEGWPIPLGGSQSIANALERYFVALGGKVETGRMVRTRKELPTARVTLFDVTPRQLLSIMGEELSPLYRTQLNRYRYGMGVFKVDWALSSPVPFAAAACRAAGTVHLGGTFEEIAQSEYDSTHGRLSAKPFVLFAQPSVFDPSRAPEGKHTGWAYCHVPNGSVDDRTEIIEAQIERFAPGFRDCILARHTMNTVAFEVYNPNNVGGDINGGNIDITQLFTRPALRMSPYRTSVEGVYLCSASTPPGGGVHGMGGFHAATQAIKDLFPDHRAA